MRKNLFSKWIAAGTALFFFSVQTLPSGFAAADPIETLAQSHLQAVKNAEEAAKPEPQDTHTDIQTDIDFLQDSLSLSAPESEEEKKEEAEEKSEEEKSPEITAAPEAPEETTFDAALEYLKTAKNFAVTAVKNLTLDNLKTLASQAWETGIAVVKGVILLFTDHVSNSLSVTAGFKKILDESADFLSHFHVRIGDAPALLKPSLKDIEEADGEEYMAGLNGENELVVRAYSHEGADAAFYDGHYLLDKIGAAQQNFFFDENITEIQRLIRSEEVLDGKNMIYERATGTNLPGFPVLTNFASQNPQGAIAVTQFNSSVFQMDYNVTNASFVGTTINFGASVNGPQNLSGYAGFSFDMRRGDNNCFGNGIICTLVEFKDTSGGYAKIAIYNLSTSWQQIDIPKSALLNLNPFLNFGAIKEINFIQDTNTIGFGSIQIGSNGLSYTPVLEPDGANPAVTKLPVTSTGERPALTAFSSQDGSSTNVQVFSATSARINYTGVSNASYGGAFLNYDNASTGSVETINFNSVYSSGLVIEMNDNGTPTDTLTFELTDINNKKETVFLNSIAGSSQRWKILPGHFAEIDLTKIKTLSIVFKGLGNQGQTSGSLNLNWGDFLFTPTLNPDGSNPAVTGLPLTSQGIRPELIGFAAQDGSTSNLTMFSTTFGRFRYTGNNANSYGGAFINYDDPNTGGKETINLNSLFPNGIVFSIDNNNTGAGSIAFEVTDSSGKKDTVNLGSLQAFGQKYKVMPGVFDEVNVTQIVSLAFVFKGGGVKDLSVDWGNFFFVPTLTPVGGNPATTTLPATSTGLRPELTGFAKADGSSGGVTMFSQTFGRIRYIGNNSTSYGGAFINYDNADTAAKETINLNSLFSTGIVFALDNNNSGLSSITFEATDNTGKKDTVVLGSIQNFGQKYRILPSAFDEIDVTKIVSLAFVFKGASSGVDLSVDWGNFDYFPQIPPDGSNPAITQIPVTSTGARPELTGFASQDGSSGSTAVFSSTFGRVHYVGASAISYGGAFLNYDDPNTTPKETINLSSLFPSGMVFQLDNNGTAFQAITFEVTDNLGRKDTVQLTQLANFGKKYRIQISLFDEVDVTKIVSMAFVFKGATAAAGLDLNVDWGKFLFTPTISPDASNPAVTTLPVDSTGARPALTGFASQDGSTGSVTQFSTTFGRVHYRGIGAASFGGAFINYDNVNTGGIETINLSSLYPGGMVFTLDNAGTSFTSISLEVTDINGKKDTVILGSLQSFGQKYKVLPAAFDEVDVTRIASLAFVFKGATAAAGLDLSVDWGNFAFIPGVNPDGTNPAITKLPVNSLGVRPALTGFATQDGSSANVTVSSTTFARVTYNGAGANSFGGAFVSYDDFNTGATETINLNSLFSSGIVFQLDNNSTALGSILFEVTDINGKKDTVRLSSLAATGQKYKILPSLFDEVDVTKIASMAFLFKGAASGLQLSIDWGNFAFVPTVNPDGTNPATTTLPVDSTGARPALTGFASQDGSSSTATTFSATFGRYHYVGTGVTSFGGAFINYDNFDTGAIESINLNSLFSNGMVFQLDNNGTGATSVTFEVTDANGKKDSVTLALLASTGKKYKVLPSFFDEVDLTKIVSLAFVYKGATSAAGLDLSIDWGNFAFVPTVNPDGTNPAITTLPVDSTGARPALTGFAKQDGSSSTATTFSATFGRYHYVGTAATSFGGAFINYDNFNTGPVETINLASVFASGIVFQLDNNGTGAASVTFEVTDVNGKKDSVTLAGLASTGKKYKVLPSFFDEVDLTKIASLAFVYKGATSAAGLDLSIDWGNFAFVPTITADGTNPAVTQLPAASTGFYPQLNGFASQFFANGQPDYSQSDVTMISGVQARVDLKIFGDTSYGGAFVSYDNAATTGTVESINFGSLYAGGLVIGLDNGGTSGMTEVFLELTDASGKKDRVKLSGLTASQKRWKILPGAFDEIDLTKVSAFALVVEGPHVDKILNITWGNFAYTPAITSDATNPSVTRLPANSLGNSPEFVGFARQDFSSADITTSSATQSRIDFKLFNANSFGGGFVSYDNPDTTTVTESVSFTSLFPSGLVIGLDNGGTGVSSVSLELTDASGKAEKVTLTGITSSQKRWKILSSAFQEINLAQIKTFALVLTGQNLNKVLNVDWGNFAFTPSVASDPSNPAVTLLPATGQGVDPLPVGFASTDYASSDVTVISRTQAGAHLRLFNPGSFGGLFLSYDNAATTTTVETINVSSLFASGIVLGLDNGGTGLTEVELELTDNIGRRDSVKLTGITASAKRWKVALSLFDGVDLTKIQTFSLVVKGVNVDKDINVNWGNFAFTPSLSFDGTNPAITLLPLTSTGRRPQPNGFASQDFSSADVTVPSLTNASVSVKMFNPGSFAGMFLSYDDAATTTVTETINLSTLFPSGIVLGLTNPLGSGSVGPVEFEVTDNLGRKDSVKLTGISDVARRWKIPVSIFDGVDVTKITTLSLVIKGIHPTATLGVNWGNFNFVPQISYDASNPTVTRLPYTSTGPAPALTGFASSVNPATGQTDYSSVNAVTTSSTTAQLDFHLFNGNSFGGAFVSYDNPATTTVKETINLSSLFSGGMVLGLNNGGTDLSSIKIEVTDADGKKDSVQLVNITALARKWKILPGAFDEVDITRITTISFVLEGRATNAHLNIDWGYYDYAPEI